MQSLEDIYRKKISLTDMSFVRSMEASINWTARLVVSQGKTLSTTTQEPPISTVVEYVTI